MAKKKAPAKAIPAEIQQQAEAIIERFNSDALASRGVRYVPRFKGAFLYLDREAGGRGGPICWLKYTGSLERWDFAIYKYSSGTYDAGEWFFPGSQFVDGTLHRRPGLGIESSH